MIKKIKRYMTLLEVIIAMGMLSVLLVIIFGFFRELSTLNNYTKARLQEGFQQRYVESRLSYAFSHIVNENANNRTFYFFTTKDEASKFPSLVFSFDNDIVLDADVGGDVLARLFVDNDKRLCLAVWPMDDEETPSPLTQSLGKFECLLENVQDLNFWFLSPPEAEKSIETDAVKGPPKGEWIQSWNLDYEMMPVIVRIEVSCEKEAKKVFSFVLPSSENPVKFVAK